MNLSLARLPALLPAPGYPSRRRRVWPHVLLLALTTCAVALMGTASAQQGANPGSLDASFTAGTDKIVARMALQPDGKILLAGGFTQVNGQAHGNVARLNADGTLDPAFNAATNISAYGEGIETMVLAPDGKVLLGGYFTQVNGVARNHVARLNADGSLDAAFSAGTDFNYPLGGSSGATVVTSVEAIALQPDGKILLGGFFGQVNGVARHGIVRLNADGSLDPTLNASVDSTVLALAVQPDGKVLLGGFFSQVNGQTRRNLARLNADGSLDFGFQASADDLVLALVVQPDGRVLLGGHFSQVNGVAHHGLARLNADGGVDAGFLGGLTTGDGVNAILPAGDRIVIGGSFFAVNGVARASLARLNADGSLDPGFLAGTDGNSPSVNALAVQADGRLLLGGRFSAVNGVAHPNVARLVTSAGTPPTTPVPAPTPTPTPAVPAPVFTSVAVPEGQVGQPFRCQLAASNGPTSYGVTGLPTGLTLNATTGVIEGTPASAGSFPLSLSATNAGGTGVALASLQITAVLSAPALTSAASASAYVGEPFRFVLTATANPTSFTAAGLPGGLSLDGPTGVISGVPTLAGAFPVNVSAANAAGTATGTLTLNLMPVPGSPSAVSLGVDAPTISRGAGQVATVTFTRTGGDPSRTIVVAYAVSGPLLGGNDYVTLAGTKKIKAGKASASVLVQPLASGGDGKVKLSVLPGDGYTVGSPAKVKIKLTD